MHTILDIQCSGPSAIRFIQGPSSFNLSESYIHIMKISHRKIPNSTQTYPNYLEVATSILFLHCTLLKSIFSVKAQTEDIKNKSWGKNYIDIFWKRLVFFMVPTMVCFTVEGFELYDMDEMMTQNWYQKRKQSCILNKHM
ncbi:unnamed protein product [Ilex paraguariensis]|uniref:Uncharacterized protein n=1 Tax=Ilex paraguariensis TaxID=185542 RepID=A0ABC8R2L1_9AQUA